MLIFVNDDRDMIHTIQARDVKIEQGPSANTSYLNGNLVTIPPAEVEATISSSKGAAALDFGKVSGPHAMSWEDQQTEIALDKQLFELGLRM